MILLFRLFINLCNFLFGIFDNTFSFIFYFRHSCLDLCFGFWSGCNICNNFSDILFCFSFLLVFFIIIFVIIRIAVTFIFITLSIFFNDLLNLFNFSYFGDHSILGKFRFSLFICNLFSNHTNFFISFSQFLLYPFLFWRLGSYFCLFKLHDFFSSFFYLWFKSFCLFFGFFSFSFLDFNFLLDYFSNFCWRFFVWKARCLCGFNVFFSLNFSFFNYNIIIFFAIINNNINTFGFFDSFFNFCLCWISSFRLFLWCSFLNLNYWFFSRIIRGWFLFFSISFFFNFGIGFCLFTFLFDIFVGFIVRFSIRLIFSIFFFSWLFYFSDSIFFCRCELSTFSNMFLKIFNMLFGVNKNFGKFFLGRAIRLSFNHFFKLNYVLWVRSQCSFRCINVVLNLIKGLLECF